MPSPLARKVTALIAAVTLAFIGISTAAAAPPANDTIDSAIVLSDFPYGASIVTTDATVSPDDPQPICGAPADGTVWYRYTAPQDALIQLQTSSSSYQSSISVLSGAPGSLSTITCGLSFVGFDAVAGTTYYFMISAQPSYGYPSPTRLLYFQAVAYSVPSNNNFANATPLGGLPSSANFNTTSASLEVGEPNLCNSTYDFGKTVWYSFTPTSSQSLTLLNYAFYGSAVTVYTGSSLTSLSKVAQSCYADRLSFAAQASTTYYIQFGGISGTYGQAGFTLDVTPPPSAEFSINPDQPSTLDTITFFSYAHDPGGVGISQYSWSFGDGQGVNPAGGYVVHKYATDGDYVVQHTVTTPDGRTGTRSTTLQVRTRDVAITKLGVPQSASSGQTRQITVGIRNTRYPQSVTVTLFRSDPSGYVPVGTLTNAVPVRPSNRTTDFTFSYTFTSQDASYGKVTFKAVAQINDGRDAFPADNEAIALPTKVNR
jgi:hypothetical protein